MYDDGVGERIMETRRLLNYRETALGIAWAQFRQGKIDWKVLLEVIDRYGHPEDISQFRRYMGEYPVTDYTQWGEQPPRLIGGTDKGLRISFTGIGDKPHSG